jgi:hypothetical protein
VDLAGPALQIAASNCHGRVVEMLVDRELNSKLPESWRKQVFGVKLEPE